MTRKRRLVAEAPKCIQRPPALKLGSQAHIARRRQQLLSPAAVATFEHLHQQAEILVKGTYLAGTGDSRSVELAIEDHRVKCSHADREFSEGSLTWSGSCSGFVWITVPDTAVAAGWNDPQKCINRKGLWKSEQIRHITNNRFFTEPDDLLELKSVSDCPPRRSAPSFALQPSDVRQQIPRQ